MGKKRLYYPGTQVVFTQHKPLIQKIVVGRKDGQCRWCGLVTRKSALSQHVPECRDKHIHIRGA